MTRQSKGLAWCCADADPISSGELQGGLTHFFYPGNSLLGDELWRDYDGRAVIYKSTQDSGHVFYRLIRLGGLEKIPLILVLSKENQRLQTKIGSDRRRKH